MIEDFLHRPWVVAQLRASVFGQDLDALTDELQRIGYTVSTIQNHLHAAGHLAHWLGHESPETTHLYVEPDLAMKERALKKLQDPPSKAFRFRASDRLLAFLDSL